MKLSRTIFPSFSIAGMLLALPLSGARAATSPDLEARLKALEDQVKADAAEIAALKKANGTKTSGANRAAKKPNGAAQPPASALGPTESLKTRHVGPTNSDVQLQQLSDGFDVPESPAAAAVGMSQDKTQHLKTPKQLIPAVINGLDEHGNFQSGLSVDWAPMQYFWASRPLSSFRYSNDDGFPEDLATWGRRVLVRTQISLAATRGTSDADKSSKIALGIHSVLANSDDPLSTVNPKLLNPNGTQVAVDANNDGKPLDYKGRPLNHWVLGMDEFKIIAGDRLNGEGFLQDAARAIYSHVSWAVGAAPLLMSPDGESDYKYAGTTAWSSFAITPPRNYPFKLVADVIYKNGESLPTSDAIGGASEVPAGLNGAAPKTINQDSLSISGGIRFGTRDFNATLTGGYVEANQHSLGRDSSFRYAISIEKRVSTNSYFTLSISKDSGHDDGRNPTIMLGGMKIGLGAQDLSSAGQQAEAAIHDGE